MPKRGSDNFPGRIPSWEAKNIDDSFAQDMQELREESTERINDVLDKIARQAHGKLMTIPVYLRLKRILETWEQLKVRDLMSDPFSFLPLLERKNNSYEEGFIAWIENVELLACREEGLKKFSDLAYNCIYIIKLFTDNEKQKEEWLRLYSQIIEILPITHQFPIITERWTNRIEINIFWDIKKIDKESGEVISDETNKRNINPEILSLLEEVSGIVQVWYNDGGSSISRMQEIVFECEEELRECREQKESADWKKLLNYSKKFLEYITRHL